MVGMEVGTCRSGRIGGSAGSITVGKARRLAARGLSWSRGGNRLPEGDEESVGGDAETGVVVEASPTSAFIVAQSQLLLEFLIIPLNPPAQLGGVDQFGDRRVGRQGGEPILARLGLALRPLDQEPFFPMRLGSIEVPGGRTQANGGEARAEFGVGSLPPGDGTPSLGREFFGQGLGRDRLVIGVAAKARGRPALAAPRLG